MEVARALHAPDVVEQFGRDGADVLPTSRADFGKFIQNEIAKWGKIVRERNIKPD